jgi:hypothetical protein
MPHTHLVRRLACLTVILLVLAVSLPLSGISTARAQDGDVATPTLEPSGTETSVEPSLESPALTETPTPAPTDTETPTEEPTATLTPETPAAETPTGEPDITLTPETPEVEETTPTVEPSSTPFTPACQPGDRTTTISLDGVALSVCTSALPGELVSTNPDDFAQIAGAIKRNPYQGFSIQAVPFGVAPPFESLPAAGPGLAPDYLEALRQYRLNQAAQITEAPAAALFGNPVPGIASLVNLRLYSDVPSPAIIVEWVAEAGNRLWIIRASQELEEEGASAAAGAFSQSLATLVISSDDLSAASTSLAAQANPPPTPEENNEASAQSTNLPSPDWWSGDCDKNNFPGSYPLGASYRGVKACGPTGTFHLVIFETGFWGEYEWQCVELSMRYMYLAYGIHPYSGDGNDVVYNYPGTLLKKIYNNGVKGLVPVAGDVLSYGSNTSYGHTAIVSASDVDSSGNGTVTVVEQNASSTGTSTLSVKSWVVNSKYGMDIIGWLHRDNPKPALSSIYPTSVDVGSGDIWLEVDGSNFISNSIVRWDGANLTTVYSSGSKLMASVPAAKLASADTVSITVYNPSPGGGTSSAKTFTINNLVPGLTGISPTNTLAGSSTLTLTATGMNFVKTSKVYFNGHALTTTYVSPTQLKASLSSSYMTLAGLYPVTVVSPAPGGGTSSTQTFTVNNHVPTISSLSPSSVIAGNKTFTLTVNGSYIVAGSKVRWNSTDLATTYASSSKLTAVVPAELVALYGTATVTIFNPTPGGGISPSATFTIKNPLPALSGIAPAHATAGSSTLTLTLSGSNFASSSIARWDGVDLSTTYASSSQLTTQVSSSLLASHKWANVTVYNPSPGGGTSTAQTFKVNSATPTKCLSAANLNIGSSITGNNAATGSTDNIDYYPSVSWDAHAPEFTYLFNAPRTTTVSVWLTGTSSSLKTILIDGASGSCDSANTLASGDQLAFDATAGHAYYIVVDGYQGHVSDYQINMDEFLPANGSNLNMLRPTFYWPAIAGATSYKLQLSKSSKFSSTLLSAKTTSNGYTATSDLPVNTRIYWRVLANTGKYVTMPKGYLSFTSANPPSVPKLSKPSNKTLLTVYGTTLDWSDSTLPVGVTLSQYKVQWALDPYFASGVVEKTTTESSYPIAVGGLTPNTRYYWRVQAIGSNGHSSSWSSVYYFRAAMLPPVQVSPANALNPAVVTPRPTFQWNAVTGATSYTIQISSRSDFSKVTVTGKPSIAEYTPTSDLPKNIPMYWRVRAEGANGPSLWSTAWSFTSANPPTTPSLSSPSKNSLQTSYTPTLDWKDSVAPLGVALEHYQLQVALDSYFTETSLVLNVDAGAVSNYALPLTSALSPEKRYYWRVQAVGNNGHASTWSNASYFRTAMPAPVLKLPDEGILLATRRPEFDWASIPTLPGASSYTIQVSNSTSFKKLYLSKTVTASRYTATSSLPAGTTLYWRVRANGPNGPSLWSNVASFKTP